MTPTKARAPRGDRAEGSAGGALRAAALVLLLACMAARTFLGELPFRLSQLKLPPAGQAAGQEAKAAPDQAEASGEQESQQVLYDRADLARVTFAVLLLAAWAAWLLGCAAAGRLRLRCGYLGWVILAFAALSLASALTASDRRGALVAWVEQASLLGAGLLAAQIFADRGRWALLLIVLAGLGAALAAKGIYQEAVERPERIADFEAHRAERLAQLGLQEGTPEARMMELRLQSQGALGYFALANPFGSLLIVLLGAGAGVALDKLVRARRLRRLDKPRMKRGEIHAPTLAAWLTVPAAAAIAVTLVLTRSRGAIGAVAIVAVAAAVVLRFREGLSRHWRKAALAVAGLFVLGAGAVVSYGLARDRLPTKTLTFRWFYWTGSAKIIAHHPVLGVGPGNFAEAYLRHRRPAAEEAVKNPHNVIVNALAQYGIPGGVCYLAVLGAMLVGACGRGKRGQEPFAPRKRLLTPFPPLRDARALTVLVTVVLAVACVRSLLGNAAASPSFFILEAVIPAGVLGACLAVFAWGPGRDAPGAQGPHLRRVLLACACAGFVLHNMVTFSMWMPGAATAFWVAAGACLARANGGRESDVTRLRWPLAIAGAAAVLACGALLWRPTLLTTLDSDAMVRAVHDGDYALAFRCAQRAAQADRLDPIPAADAAKLALTLCPPGRPAAMQPWLLLAYRWARQAAARDPMRSGYDRLSGSLAWYLADTDNLTYTHLWASLPAAEQVRKLREALERRPSAVLYGRLGDLAWRWGQWDQAYVEWRRSARAAPRGSWVAQALAHTARGVDLDPSNLGLRVEYARMLCSAVRADEAVRQLDAAEKIDAALLPGSAEAMTQAERAEVRRLRERAKVIRDMPAAGPATRTAGATPAELAPQ